MSLRGERRRDIGIGVWAGVVWSGWNRDTAWQGLRDTLLWDTLVGHACGALLLKSPKVTRQVSKTSVSFETSYNSHMSKSPERASAFGRRPHPKNKREVPWEHTHQAKCSTRMPYKSVPKE